MQKAQDYYPDCPEAFLVSLARTGDRKAFAELVQRRQSQVRNLMRRCCNDYTLADDLTQQVFLKVWLSIRKLRKASAFTGWLKRVAVSVWLQHIRKKDVPPRRPESSIQRKFFKTPGLSAPYQLKISSTRLAMSVVLLVTGPSGLRGAQSSDLSRPLRS